ncbi:MAG TPA: gas vesicle protein GvpO [Conexibacter sp.]
MKPRELVTAAIEEMADLVGLPVESVSGIERDDDGTWRVTVEVRELERVPDTMDVLASYEVRLSDDGEVVGFHRTRRYPRSAADGRMG